MFKVIVIYYTDLGSDGNSNSNILMFKVIVIYYTDLGSDGNSNSNILMFKVIVIIIIIILQLTSCVTNNVISCDYNIINHFYDTHNRKCSFSNQKPEGRYNITLVSVIGTYLK